MAEGNTKEIVNQEISVSSDALTRCFALADCNNFYASCERVFNPKLNNQPIVVLSNNDGCIVARSNEVKKMKVGMGEPFFKFRRIIENHKVHVFSSNYTLYGDMSRRVMSTLSRFTPEMEIYSIDEAFLNLEGCDYLNGHNSLTEYTRMIRATVLQWTGIPISIGIARTKTLAKIANHLAKRSDKTDGVLDLVDSSYLDKALEKVYVWDVWGIGKNHGRRLAEKGIVNARQLRDMDDNTIRKQMGVVGVRLLYELRGISCLSLSTVPSPRKGIVSSRSFGRKVSLLTELKEAVAAYVTKAAIKLRSQNSAAKLLTVFLMTDHFSKQDKQYSNTVMIRLPTATSNTAELICYAMQGTERIFREGYLYQKAGVMLDDIIPADQVQMTLFSSSNIEHSNKLLRNRSLCDKSLGDESRNNRLMKTIDMVNEKMGSDTLYYAAQGRTQPWKMKCELRSRRYTTDWKELMVVVAN